MCRFKSFLCLIACLSIFSVYGQQKANYKQAEKFRTVGSEVGSLSVSPVFLKNSNQFWYSYKTGDGTKYYLVDPDRKSKTFLFDNNDMAEKLTKITTQPYHAGNLGLEKLEFKDDRKTLKFIKDSIHYEYDIHSKILSQKDSVNKEKEKKNDWATYSPDSTYMLFAKKHNLYMMKCGDKDSVEIQLTTDGKSFYSYASDERSTSSKRTKARANWFKDSKKFYVLRSDRRKVKDLWVLNVLADRPKLEEYRYSMPGDKDVAQYELSVFDLETRKQLKIDAAKWPDQSLSVVYTGLKNSDKIYFQRKRRTCDEVEIGCANTTTGEIKILINEKGKPYLNDQMYHLSILEDGKDLIWWSERTGWGHFYHYDVEGNLKNQITSGEWVAGKMVRIDTVGRTIYFEGYGKEKDRNPYYSFVYKANIDDSKVTLLTPENANHGVSMPQSCKYIVDNYSRVDMEPRSVLRDNKGKVIMELARPDLKRLYETGWKMPETFVVKAKDGITDLYGVMWKPFDFDSTRKYPVISYVYPGPQMEALTLGFSLTSRQNVALAQLGFIVVNFGHRGGSPQRNKWYHTYGYGNLRDYALADDKYGIEQLADRCPFIDISKVGIFGHSGGGFMSTAALCYYPDFYTAAVSSSGNHDNNIYNLWWGETHNGVKEIQKTVKDSVKGDREEIEFKSIVAKNQDLAYRLKGHLLLVTGDMDNNVHPGNTLRMADALIRAGKNFDMLVLPGQRHGYAGKTEEFFQRKLWFHFSKYLLGDDSMDQFYEIDGFNRRH